MLRVTKCATTHLRFFGHLLVCRVFADSCLEYQILFLYMLPKYGSDLVCVYCIFHGCGFALDHMDVYPHWG